MSDQTRISGQVVVEPTSKEYVAYKLMDSISRSESSKDHDMGKREYWLTLYVQCYKAANGATLSAVLDAGKLK